MLRVLVFVLVTTLFISANSCVGLEQHRLTLKTQQRQHEVSKQKLSKQYETQRKQDARLITALRSDVDELSKQVLLLKQKTSAPKCTTIVQQEMPEPPIVDKAYERFVQERDTLRKKRKRR